MAGLKILTVDINRPSDEVIARAAGVLDHGGLVVAPTETRYGLLTRADRQESLDRLCRLKERALTNPVSLFVRRPADIGRLGHLNEAAQLLSAAFLPGPLTLVLRSLVTWPPPCVVAGKIGLRCSSAVLIAALMNAVDFALSATSANLSGRPEHDSVQGIVDEFADGIDLYLDGGSLVGRPSTVVDCTGAAVKILREGAIGAEKIRDVLGQ